jgi:hypothetical protein
LNLDRSISNLSKRIDRFDSVNGDGNDSSHWRVKEIIPLNEWIQLKGTPHELQSFPDDFSEVWTHVIENELQEDGDDQKKKWHSDYLDLMEYKRNRNYGKSKCFPCLLSPSGDDPIFIGINRLVAKGLEDDKADKTNYPMLYPCHVENRFECPYDYEKGKGSDATFNVEDLFELANMAFAVEIALAVARKESSTIQIKNKQDLYHALTNREMLDMILEQGLDYVLSDKETFDDESRFDQLQRGNRDKIVDYFMNIKDKIKLEELRFY